MRLSLFTIPLLFALSLPGAPPGSESRMPMMTSVEPASGASGDILTVQGANLGKDDVAAVFLTDGNNDLKAIIVDQTSTSLKLKVPAEAKAGRFALMVQTTGKDSRLIEEPVKVTIESPGPGPTSD
jgi:hypothetical protein